MLSPSDILNLLSQVTWPGFASGVTTTVGVGGLWIAWRRYRHDRQRPAPVFEVTAVPPSPPTELPAVQVMEIHVRPDRSRPLRLALAVGPRRSGGRPPGSLLLFWEWADERTRTHQTRIRF
jgi:hypothetical protein